MEVKMQEGIIRYAVQNNIMRNIIGKGLIPEDKLM